MVEKRIDGVKPVKGAPISVKVEIDEDAVARYLALKLKGGRATAMRGAIRVTRITAVEVHRNGKHQGR